MIMLPADISSARTNLAPYQNARAYTANIMKNISPVPIALYIPIFIPDFFAAVKLTVYLQ